MWVRLWPSHEAVDLVLLPRLLCASPQLVEQEVTALELALQDDHFRQEDQLPEVGPQHTQLLVSLLPGRRQW